MAEAGLYLGWGTVVRGREKVALDVVLLNPTGGDAGGFILLRGSAQQIDSLRRDDEFQTLQNRVQLIVDGLRITDAIIDEGLAQQIPRFEKVIGQFA
jgi:hypothetical protein